MARNLGKGPLPPNLLERFGKFDEPDFIGPFSDTAENRLLFRDVLDIGMQFKTQHKVKAKPKPIPQTLSFGPLPREGISYEELFAEYKDIASGSVNWASPNFVGFPDSGNSVPAMLSALLIPLLNQNLANQDVCSPIATLKEMEVVHWLRSNLGYPTPEVYNNAIEIGGCLTVGGSLSNAIALVAARESLFPGSGVDGLPVLAKDIRVLVPDVIEHYSIRSALSSISIGGANVVRVPVDDEFRMILPELERCIDEERQAGRYIMACIAYAGDSRTMCIDNLNEIADVLQRKKVWFHVDACHGQSLAFSRTHRHKLAGIERSDSVTIDPHKVLFVPYQNSFVLFRDPKCLLAIGTSSELITKTQWSLGQITPFLGSKSFDALKMWSTIKYFGQEGIERIIDARLELTAAIQAEVRRREDLILLNRTDINACLILFMPAPIQAAARRLRHDEMALLNDTTKELKTAIQESGDFFIHGFPLRRVIHSLLPDDHPVYVLRIMQGNPLTNMDNVRCILDRVVTTGKNILLRKQSKVATSARL